MTSYISQRNQIPLLDFRMAVRGRQYILRVRFLAYKTEIYYFIMVFKPLQKALTHFFRLAGYSSPARKN